MCLLTEMPKATVVNPLITCSRFLQRRLYIIHSNAISFSPAVHVITVASTDESSVTATSMNLIHIIDNILMHDLCILKVAANCHTYGKEHIPSNSLIASQEWKHTVQGEWSDFIGCGHSGQNKSLTIIIICQEQLGVVH